MPQNDDAFRWNRTKDILGAADYAAMAFSPGPVSIQPASEPVVSNDPFAEDLRGEYEGFPFAREAGPLSVADEAKVRAYAMALARILRNTNLTTADPAHVAPQLWSEPINLDARVTVPAVAAAPNIWQTAISYRVPDGRAARFFSYGWEVLDPAYTYDGSLEWRIQVQGATVPTLNNMIRQRGSPLQPRETYIQVPQDQLIILQVRRAVAAAAPQDIDHVLNGWTWRLRNDYEGTRSATTAY